MYTYIYAYAYTYITRKYVLQQTLSFSRKFLVYYINLATYNLKICTISIEKLVVQVWQLIEEKHDAYNKNLTIIFQCSHKLSNENKRKK